MLRNRTIRMLAAPLALAALAATAQAQLTVYNNFGPGNDGFEYITGTSHPMGGFLGPAQHAQAFTTDAGGPLSDIYLGIFRVLPTPVATIRLAVNNGAGPQLADVLEEWVVSSLPTSSGGPITHLVSQTNPVLEAGASYWVWITISPSSAAAAWGFAPDNTLSVPRTTRSGTNPAGSWPSPSNNRPGALRVDVSDGAPCPGDFNGDGVRDTADFFEFFGGFFGNPPNADYNGDGGTDTSDFFEFFADFFGPPCS